MNLKTFRKSEKLTLDQMGVRLGVSGATVQRWETGKMRPSWEHIPAIERVTAGQVTAADFVPQPTEQSVAASATHRDGGACAPNASPAIAPNSAGVS